MNQIALNRQSKNQDPNCGDLMTMAERELSAFYSAVTELLGSEEAEAAAEDWLQELVAIHDLPASVRQWRQLTVEVAARFANRVNASAIQKFTLPSDPLGDILPTNVPSMPSLRATF